MMNLVSESLRQHARSREAEEQGFALPMALLCIVLLGTLVTALLSFTATTAQSGSVNRASSERVYSTHAGLDHAIQEIRSGSTLCLDGSTFKLDMNTGSIFPIRKVEVTCRTSGSSADVGPGGWSVFATNGITAQGIRPIASAIVGPVYNGGTWNLGVPLQVANGYVVDGGSCTATAPANLDTTPAPIATGYRCLGAASPAVAPLPTPIITAAGLPATAPTAAAASTVVSGCRVFSPGTYTSLGQLALGTHNYFQPGVYYLNNVGQWDIGRWVTAGRPIAASDDKRLTTYDVAAGPCASSMPPAPPVGTTNAANNGAMFVLGGSSSIRVLNVGGTAGRFEVYGFADLADLTKPRVSVKTFQTGDPGWIAASTAAGPVLSNVQGAPGPVPELAIHGIVAVPGKAVAIQANAGGIAKLAGGALVGTLDMAGNAIVDPSTFGSANDAGRGQRRVNVTSAALPNGTGRVVKGFATLLLFSDPDKTVSVDSWRIAGVDGT